MRCQEVGVELSTENRLAARFGSIPPLAFATPPLCHFATRHFACTRRPLRHTAHLIAGNTFAVAEPARLQRLQRLQRPQRSAGLRSFASAACPSTPTVCSSLSCGPSWQFRGSGGLCVSVKNEPPPSFQKLQSSSCRISTPVRESNDVEAAEISARLQCVQ